tara:strand:+ start:4385 stop:5230 length:846 start_codon:yes stop_codon:yes gene_type:complete
MVSCINLTQSIFDYEKHQEYHRKKIQSAYMKSIYFSYIAKKTFLKDKLVFYYTTKAIQYIRNCNENNYIDALHFVTVVPHYLNETQLKQIKPLLDAIDTTYYVNFYKTSITSNNSKIIKLREEMVLKDTYIKGVYGSAQVLTLSVGIISTDCIEIPLKTLTGTGVGLTITIQNKKLEIVKNGSNYQKNDVVYTTYFGGCGLFFLITQVGAQDAAFQVNIDPVFAGLPIYVIAYNYNARMTLNYDLELLNLIKYESEKYGNDFVVKKYIIRDDRNTNNICSK